MVDSTQGRRRRRRYPVVSPVLRPALWSALLGAVAAAALATPAWADPLPDTVPSTGSRPQVAGTLQLPTVPGAVPGLPGTVTGGPGRTPGLPGTTPAVTNPADGPLIAQINQVDAQVAQLGDTLLGVKGERDTAQADLTLAAARLKEAQDALLRAQENAKNAAADAVKADAALPPGEFGASLRELANLQRITRGDKAEGATTAVTGELARATAAEQVAREAHASAARRATEKAAEYTRVETDLHKQEATLLKLRRDNAAKLREIERREDAAEQQLGSSYVVNQSVSGRVADPRALAAVRYALAQLGDPYLWAAEGPDRFDCSGLVLAAYQSAGYHGLPRVSRDQYYATRSRTVDPNALLPGDLLFFASGSSWTSIHHVTMYIGNGKMVEAPRTGDVVKISVVRWSRLYAATRVLGAVPAPATPAGAVPAPATPAPTVPTTPPTTPPATPSKPNPTPKPTKTATPKPTRTATPKPTPSTSSPTPSPSTSPSTTTPPPPTSAPPSPSASPTSSEGAGSAEPSTSSAAPASSAAESSTASPSATD
ncbi:NlpC/P60 family protein [Micromonospora chaiyaphumensis]|uniref:Cell wall-associated hydrolase, NlpC family n=1 Tax=Micromonospora chaiyaphumensis TaxID=307119 RepID=A0A1C4VT23_9ACTN|nr:C40 family peptidase [Micromonospora chaiyaphumensis]SCE87123.1 Cell wall-associated hydrolase, NlpC family [Micromonospora chaiyaphumensis]